MSGRRRRSATAVVGERRTQASGGADSDDGERRRRATTASFGRLTATTVKLAGSIVRLAVTVRINSDDGDE